jgi:hypothetical protein
MNSLTSTAKDGSGLTIDQVLCFLCLPAYLKTPSPETENALRYYLKESLITSGTPWLEYVKNKTAARPEFVEKFFSLTEDPERDSLLYHAVKNRSYALAKKLIENYDARDLVDALDYLDGCLWKGLTLEKRTEFDDMHAYLLKRLATQCPQTPQEEAKFKALFFKYLNAGKKEEVKILLGNPYYDFSSFKDAQDKSPLKIIESWWTGNHQDLSLAIIARNAKPTLPRTQGLPALPQPVSLRPTAEALPAPARPAITFSPKGTSAAVTASASASASTAGTASGSAIAAATAGVGGVTANSSGLRPPKPTLPRSSVSAASASVSAVATASTGAFPPKPAGAPPKPSGPRPTSSN